MCQRGAVPVGRGVARAGRLRLAPRPPTGPADLRRVPCVHGAVVQFNFKERAVPGAASRGISTGISGDC